MDEYILGEPIGYGSFSIVYEARSRKTNETFAVKLAKIEEYERQKEMIVIDNADRVFSYDMNRIEREIELWKPLDHDNLCRLVDVFIEEKEGKVGFIMEYAQNGDLLNLLSENELPFEVIKDYFLQLCEAVKYLHEKGVVHGDIKLENILINEPRIKLSDFGLAKRAYSDNIEENCGTVEYAAPELLSEDKEEGLDPFKADMWALGVVLYALLHRQFPFDGPTPKLLKIRILTTEPVYASIDNERMKQLHELTKKLLEKNWKRRPTVDEVLSDLK